MTLSEKMRTLASQDFILQGYFGVPPLFRWYSGVLPQGGWTSGIGGPVARVQEISSTPIVAMEGIGAQPISWCRVQVDVIDQFNSTGFDRATDAANAIQDWLDKRASFASQQQFDPVPTLPHCFPNFSLNTRKVANTELQPAAWVVTNDFRIQDLQF